LRRCECLTAYYMIDPWRHLNDWNKPANQDDAVLGVFLRETKTKTDFAAAKRFILRGKTTEVIEQIRNNELDLAYIDADHTLKGIAIDLIRVYPKVRTGGFLGGDDFARSVWEHKTTFEPTLVFPFAVYFAETVGATICALPYSQFCLQKGNGAGIRFCRFDRGIRRREPSKSIHPRKAPQDHNVGEVSAPDASGQENKRLTLEMKTAVE